MRTEPPGGKYKYMNLNLSTSDWLNAALGVLFLYRGIRDLYNGTGTGWSNEDEKNHFHRPFGILSLLCGALWLVNIFLHFNGRDARVLRCSADLASVLYPEQGRQKQKVRRFLWKSSAQF